MNAPTSGRAARAEPPDPVATIEWPSQHARRPVVARRGRAALLIVERGHAPPGDLGPLEDWTRPRSIRSSSRSGPTSSGSATASAEGGPCWTTRASCTTAASWWRSPLVSRPSSLRCSCRIGQPVPRTEVEQASREAGGPSQPDELRRALSRLRACVAEVGLGLHLLSGRAVLLEASATGGQFTWSRPNRKPSGNTYARS